MAAIRRFILALAPLLLAGSAFAQPMTNVVQFDNAETHMTGDFNSDGRMDLLTLEPYGPILRLGIRDAQTGVRWGVTPDNLDVTNFYSAIQIFDLDNDGRFELVIEDHPALKVRSFEIPALPAVPPPPDAETLNEQWNFTYPTFNSGAEPFAPLIASFDGVHLHMVYRDNISPDYTVAYRMRDQNGALVQTIDDEFPPTYASTLDFEGDGRAELAILPTPTANFANPRRARIYKWTAPIIAVADALPSGPSLQLVSTNPALGNATFRYSLPSASNVELVVHDVQGRAVRTLMRGRASAGAHNVQWAGESDDGASVPSGAYFIQYSAEGQKLGRKLVFIR